jgi:hypothetical protein
MALYALLVGIDAYAAPVPPLRGCVNDVRRMQAWLEQRGAQPAQITLTDAQATRAAIIQTFRSHLGQAGPGDAALFYYSGHGSQEPAPPEYRDQEPDGMDETLVAYDSRQPGGWDIADKELAVLIAEVASRGAHVAVVLDACHSGTATRLADDMIVRRAAGDTRARPAASFWFYGQAGAAPALQESSSDWRILPHGPHVLLAACRDFEQAIEFRAPEGERRGMFSYFLLETLQRLGDRISYRSLHKQVQTQVGNRYPGQVPQAEGELERRVFDGGPVPAAGQLSIRQVRGFGWRLDAGALHGVQVGSEYAVALPGVASAVVRVTEVHAAESSVALAGGSLPDDAITLPVVLSHLPLPLLRIALDGELAADTRLRAAIGSSPFLTIAGDAGSADLLVAASDGRYQLRRPGVADPIAACSNGDEVVLSLNHIARWESVRALGNHHSPLGDAVRMTVWAWLGPPLAAGERPQTASLPEQAPRLEYRTLQGQPRPGRFTVEIATTTDQPVFFALFALSESFAIQRVHNAEGRLMPDQSIWVRPYDGIPASVPDELYARGITRRHDTLLLLVSEQDADFSLLEQGKLGSIYQPPLTRRAGAHSALDGLLRRAMTREIDDTTAPGAYAWGAVCITISAERPAARQDDR